jgi:hypothetical protein
MAAGRRGLGLGRGGPRACDVRFTRAKEERAGEGGVRAGEGGTRAGKGGGRSGRQRQEHVAAGDWIWGRRVWVWVWASVLAKSSCFRQLVPADESYHSNFRQPTTD